MHERKHNVQASPQAGGRQRQDWEAGTRGLQASPLLTLPQLPSFPDFSRVAERLGAIGA